MRTVDENFLKCCMYYIIIIVVLCEAHGKFWQAAGTWLCSQVQWKLLACLVWSSK